MGKGAKRSEGSPKEPSPATAAAQAIINESRELNAKPPKTSIHRLDPETGDRKYVARVTTDVATEEWLARKFGPGTYVLTHQVPGETGAYEYHSRDTFIIDESSSLLEPPEGAHVEPSPAAGASSPAVAPITGGNILERAMEAGVLRLLEQSARHNDLAIAMVQRITEATDRPRGPTIVEIISAATPIIVALLDSRKDPTEQAVALATLLSKKSDGGEQMAAMFERGISLATKFGAGPTGGDGGMMPVVVGEGIKVLGSIIDNINADRRAARGEPVATVHPDGTTELPGPRLVPDDQSPAPTMAPPPPGGDRVWIAAARGHLPMLLAAARFMPATAAAETIAANLSPTALDDLLNDIDDATAPGFAARLAAVFPQVEGINPDWFREMLETLLEITADEPEPATPAKPPTTKRAAERK